MLSIGVLSGSSPWRLTDPSGSSNPILTASDVTDVRAAFVADPFALYAQGAWHLFFEVMSRESGKGEIGYAISTNLEDWEYQGIVLREPFHLSYPGVYSTQDGFWMIPETFEAGEVRLYRADPFPNRWVLEKVLISNLAAGDPTLWHENHENWRMLLCASTGNRNETLLHYEAPGLHGPWKACSDSPIIREDSASARPGGHSFWYKNTQYRLAQDCSRRYGERLRSFPLRHPWTEEPTPVLEPTGEGWRARATHHADIHVTNSGHYIAFVDGEA